MSRVICWACISMFLVVFASPQSGRFAGYKAVEAYEIRPGILMMPRYSGNGQVCEIGLERRHYSPEKIRLDSSLSRKEIDQVFEELVPTSERGPKSKDFDLITRGGHVMTTNTDFENISIQIFGEDLPESGRREIFEGDIVATVHWKNRKCQ